jgi:hypothetical protein
VTALKLHPRKLAGIETSVADFKRLNADFPSKGKISFDCYIVEQRIVEFDMVAVQLSPLD